MNWAYEKNRIFATDESGKLMAEATLVEKEDGEVDIEHVFVDASLRGQGVAGKTMEKVADYLRKQQKKATATCSYANGWLEKNKAAYEDIISNNLTDTIACNLNGKH